MIHDSPLLTSQSSRDDITSVRRDVLNEKNKNPKTNLLITLGGKSGVTQLWSHRLVGPRRRRGRVGSPLGVLGADKVVV